MNAAATAVVRRHVALCWAWIWTVEKFGLTKVRQSEDTALAGVQLALFAKDTPRVAAAVRAKGVG